VLLIAGINFLHMPAFRIGGDSAAVEYVSVGLINFGNLSVPEDIASTYGDRGQFYFKNAKNGKWYSKYGIANTFIFALPRSFEKLLVGDLTYRSKYRILSLNLFNILLSIFLFLYLSKLFSLYTEHLWLNLVFCFCIFYATYLSYYLRAQSAEIYQTLFFTGFFYHSVLYLRALAKSQPSETRAKATLNLIFALFFLGLSCLVKIVYILMLPGFLFILIKSNGFKATGDVIKALVFITCLLILISLIHYFKFGSAIETGYGQWEDEHDFFIMNIPKNFLASLFHPRNGLLLNFPIIILSVFGIKSYFKKHGKEVSLLFMTTVPVFILILAFENWAGEWSYGPRYFLFALPALSLPGLFPATKIFESKKKKVKYALIILIILCLNFFALINFNANALNFFIAYEIRDVHLDGVENPLVDQYFDRNHFGFIAHDLIKFRENGAPLSFLGSLENSKNEKQIEELEKRIGKSLSPNYYWFRGGS